MPALEPLTAIRVAASPEALDAVDAGDALVLRTAPDEALVIGSTAVAVDDVHAIVFPDTSWMGMTVPIDDAVQFIHRTVEFELPAERPALVQGMVAHLAVKMWLEDERILFVVPTAVSADFTERWARLS